MERRTTKIVAIILLVCMFPLVLAIPLAIFVHPSFLLLLLVLAFAIPFLRAVSADRAVRRRSGRDCPWDLPVRDGSQPLQACLAAHLCDSSVPKETP